jgi:hypothetical protein
MHAATRSSGFARWIPGGLIVVFCSLALPGAWAQDKAPQNPGAAPAAAPRETPRPDQLDPGVDTSAAAAPPPAASPSTSGGSPSGTTAGGRNTTSPAPKVATTASASGKTGVQAKVDAQTRATGAQTPTDAQAPKSGARTGKPQDRLELDTTQITGNRELPKVLYIVPWKRSDLGDLVGKPVNSLLDEVLEPVDRDVFKRENRYYDAVKPDQAKPTAAGTGAPASGEKP